MQNRNGSNQAFFQIPPDLSSVGVRGLVTSYDICGDVVRGRGVPEPLLTSYFFIQRSSALGSLRRKREFVDTSFHSGRADAGWIVLCDLFRLKDLREAL